MITITETDRGLQIVPDDIEELKECTDLGQVFEYYTCNEWEWLQPEQVGALTDGSIISNDTQYNDDCELIGVGKVYWDSAYQIESTLEELQKGNTVYWVGQD